MDIPAGVQAGAELLLKGKGVPHLEGKGRGNLRVQVKVVTPTRLDDRQRELLEELAQSFGDDVDGRDKPWFSRIKDAFGGNP
jgi:molecular chaperone DnaJ